MENNKIRVAINGFGRIGRDVFRGWALREEKNFEIVAVTRRRGSKKIPDTMHLFKYDSIYRKYPGKIELVDDGFIVDGHKVLVLDGLTPEEMPWKELGVDVVIESTGKFKDRESCEGHLKAGAKKVVITAPGKNEDCSIVLGVNDDNYCAEKHNIISNASCTTNCLAPVAKVLLDTFGIKRGFMTTVHAYTNDQRTHDGTHKDARRARAAGENIIPTTTGAAKAVGIVIPELQGKLTGMAMRVPVITGSLVDLTVELEKEVTREEINAAMKKASETNMKGVLEYSEDELVSTDIIGNPHSSIFDSLLTDVNGNLVKVVSWYDNEWGYSQRVIDLVEKVSKTFK